jgi:hypothetical protein
MLVDCNSRQEAYYLSGILNSHPAQFAAISYAVEIQFDTHLLQHIRIPSFDPGNKLHLRLSGLSEEAHKGATKGNDVSEIEAEIDDLAAEIWGLTKEELKEIKSSLEEVQ